MNRLYDLVDKSRIPYFLCVGTSKHQIDGISVFLGDWLKARKYIVLGTTGAELNGVTIPELYEGVIKNIDSRIYQPICIDTATGGGDNPYAVVGMGLRPGAAVGKSTLPVFGEVTVHINVEHFIPMFHRMFGLFIPKHDNYNEPAKQMMREMTSVLNIALTHYEDKHMKRERHAIRCADLLINQNMTVREIADEIKQSKSYVHYHLTKTLPKLNVHLANAVAEKLSTHFKEKYITGGNTTKRRYKGVAKCDWEFAR